MVDPRLVDLSSINDELRYKIFDYIWRVKRISSRELGISPSMANKVKNRKARISDTLLENMLKHLSLDEFARLTGRVTPEKLDLQTIIRCIRAALSNPDYKWLVIEAVVQAAGNELHEYASEYSVTDDDLAMFKKILTSSELAKKTINDTLRYLYVALRDLDYTLTPDELRSYILSLKKESVNRARHIAQALKKFIKEVIVPRDPVLGERLYHSFRIPKEKRKPQLIAALLGEEPVITLSDIRSVIDAFKELRPSLLGTTRYHIVAAKTYFALLAVTGLRPGEVRSLELRNIDLEKRIIKIVEETRTKRAYVAFFSAEVRRLLEKYLVLRQEFLARYSNAITNLGLTEDTERKLFPFRKERMRSIIYAAMERALNKRFALYELRKFFTSWMIQHGVPDWVINLIQGRTSESDIRTLHTLSRDIIARHYHKPITLIEDFIIYLRDEYYDKHIFTLGLKDDT